MADMKEEKEKREEKEDEKVKEPVEIPAEFQKIMKDFIRDITVTFPEYQLIVNKWWKTDIESAEISQSSIEFIFKHSLTVYPERFFDILYKNPEMFSEKSMINTEFLPGISFKYLWSCEISDGTRETIWKYLQLIILAIVGCVNNKEAFGDTSKIFDSINEDEFRNKLQETMEGMQNLFKNEENATSSSGVNMDNIPSADDIHSHLSGMMNGKLGNLAKEIAEETAGDLDLDMENITDMKDVFQNLFKNPGKLMGLVKNVGEKLDSRIKSGEISQTELLTEATEMMGKMKNTPGMENIQEMLSKMGMQMPNMAGASRNAKVDVNAMEAKLKQVMKKAEMSEKMLKKSEERKKVQEKAASDAAEAALAASKQPTFTDEQLIAMFSNMEKPTKTPRVLKEDKDKKKKKK
uniref:Uncharacterized protein n=1 Tax=viral metagenome TaxID=1070528 RepID=A0A6C0B9E9_9ZZZZ